MEFILIKCKKCGNTKNIPDTDKNIYLDRNDKEECAICGGEYELVKTTRDNSYETLREKAHNIAKESEGISISEIIHHDLIEGMKKNISRMGNDRVWEILEGFKTAQMRLSHRKIFLEAGGEAFISEIKI